MSVIAISEKCCVEIAPEVSDIRVGVRKKGLLDDFGVWCGRRDLNPHGPCGPTDFLTQLRLSPPPTALAMGFGVWTIPSPCPDLAPGVRCCPSSLYTFPAVLGPGLARDRHVTGFPEFEQFCIAGFPAGTQVFRLSPMRLPIPPRPHGFKLARIND